MVGRYRVILKAGCEFTEPVQGLVQGRGGGDGARGPVLVQVGGRDLGHGLGGLARGRRGRGGARGRGRGRGRGARHHLI